MPGQEVYAINCGSDTSENVFATNVLIKAAPKQYLALCEVNANYGYSLIFLSFSFSPILWYLSFENLKIEIYKVRANGRIMSKILSGQSLI